MVRVAEGSDDSEDEDFGISSSNSRLKINNNPTSKNDRNQKSNNNHNNNNQKNKKKSTAYASKDGEGYAWEEEYKRSWDVLREDDSGSLESAMNQIIANKRRRIIRDTSSIQRGIIRHLCLIIDVSLSMSDRDLRPNRMDLTITYIREFITEFFDQNPISQLCILITKDGVAERLSNLSGNPIDHHRALANKSKLTPSGEPSLQNSLEMARATLSHLPTHGSKEALVVFGSLTTCDPDDINQTIKNLTKDRMRVSIVGLAAEVRICKEICKTTQGKYGVILHEDHFKELLFESIIPLARFNNSNDQSIKNQTIDLIQMGFPNQISNQSIKSLCICHSDFKSIGFICPRCQTKNCENPTNCLICGLMIVSSPHLARSYRHLFPVLNWKETFINESESNRIDCYGCDLIIYNPNQIKNHQSKSILNNNNNNDHVHSDSSSFYSCQRCHHSFCLDCDLFHEQLGLCPGCCC